MIWIIFFPPKMGGGEGIENEARSKWKDNSKKALYSLSDEADESRDGLWRACQHLHRMHPGVKIRHRWAGIVYGEGGEGGRGGEREEGWRSGRVEERKNEGERERGRVRKRRVDIVRSRSVMWRRMEERNGGKTIKGQSREICSKIQWLCIHDYVHVPLKNSATMSSLAPRETRKSALTPPVRARLHTINQEIHAALKSCCLTLKMAPRKSTMI